MAARYDLITMGRVSMDLFSQNVGAPFIEIEGFATSVGGTPTNIAVGASRLGLNVAILTAVGDDLVGRFVRNYLKNEGVETRYIPEKEGTSTGLALLGIEPPDKFPLVFYRDNPADIYVDIDDVRAIPLKESRALLLSGTGLSRGPRREATLFALEQARQGGVTIFLDLDMRPNQWRHPRAFGLNLRPVLSLADVVIGTEEEFYAALMPDPESVMMAIVYGADNSVTLYRDGFVYGRYTKGSVQTYSTANGSDVRLGVRHGDRGGDVGGTAGGIDAFLAASIDEARIYGDALTENQIRAILIEGPSAVPEPGTFALLALGLVGVLAVRLRKR